MTNAEPTDRPAAVAEHGTVNAPDATAPKKGASKKNGAPQRQNPAKGAKTKADRPTKRAKASKKANATAKTKEKPKAERSNKKAEVIAMMKRAKGVTLAEIVEATGWQKHTVRGFVSILGKNGGEKIESSMNASGARTYKISK